MARMTRQQEKAMFARRGNQPRQSLFFAPTDPRLARDISIRSPREFRKSIKVLSKGGLTLKERRGLILAQNRAKAQLKRKNLSAPEIREFKEISKIKIPQTPTKARTLQPVSAGVTGTFKAVARRKELKQTTNKESLSSLKARRQNILDDISKGKFVNSSGVQARLAVIDKKIQTKMIKISVKRPTGFRTSDIGKGGKEFNIKESKEFKKQREKEVLERTLIKLKEQGITQLSTTSDSKIRKALSGTVLPKALTKIALAEKRRRLKENSGEKN